MSDVLFEFASRFGTVTDRADAESVVESAVDTDREQFEAVLGEVIEALSSPDRRRSARLLYEISEVVPGTLADRGTDLVRALEYERSRPYVAATLSNVVDEGLRTDAPYFGDRQELIEGLDRRAREGLASSKRLETRTDQDDAAAAVRYLSWIAKKWEGDVAAVEQTLVTCLRSENEDVREAATRTLSVVGGHELDGDDAIPALLELTDDPNSAVRANAVAALEGIAFQYRSNLDEIPAEVPEIVAAATERLNDVERVRYDAVFLFAEGEIWVETEGEVRWVDRVDDTHTQRAVDGLVDRLSDPVEAIVRKATSALGLYVWSETDALVDHVGDLIDYGWERSGPNRSSIRRCLKETAADHPEAVVDYVPYFLERLDEGDPDAATVVGHAAAADLDAVRDGVPDIVDVLGSPEGRVAAAKALADVYRVDPGAVPDYVETLTETIDGSEVTTRRSALWEPLATLAEDYPGVASDLAEQAVGGLARLDDPPRLRLLYELAETEPSTVGPAVDRLLELFEHDDPAVVAAAVRTLWYVFDREDTPDVPASAAESLERRLDELPEQAREDAEPIISSAKDR